MIRVVGAENAIRLVDGLTVKLRPRLQKATRAGANEFKSLARSEARTVSRRMARAVSVRTAKRERPASVLTFRPKVAFFRHFVLQGTADHGPRKAKVLRWQGRDGVIVARRVRGVQANPILDRVFAARQSAATAAVAKSLMEQE